jgi:hypothetical protein
VEVGPYDVLTGQSAVADVKYNDAKLIEPIAKAV